jgi:GNAT superfamily N-acetyltransferase
MVIFSQFAARVGTLTIDVSLLRCNAMQAPDDEITIAEDGPEIGDHIEAQLLHSLRTTSPQTQNTSFILSARDPGGALVGGLTASISYGWLRVKTLWIAEPCRRQGTGGHLMARAEGKARSLGCHGAWLDTSNPDAMRFYAELGYTTFGQLSNAIGQPPASHRRWFMEKRLLASSPS